MDTDTDAYFNTCHDYTDTGFLFFFLNISSEHLSMAEPSHDGQPLPEPPKMAKEKKKKKKKKKHLPQEEVEGGGPSGYGGGGGFKENRRAAICFVLFILLLIAIVVFLTLWLVYRPHKPRFGVVSAAVYQLNGTSPPFISTTMQFTVVMRNPSKLTTILYDYLSVVLSYRNQAITAPVMLPPLVHKTKSTVAMSPVIGGTPVVVAQEVANRLIMDENYGAVGLQLLLTGKLRYKAGGITSKHYRLHVRCDVFVALRNGFVGQLPLLRSPVCVVNV